MEVKWDDLNGANSMRVTGKGWEVEKSCLVTDVALDTRVNMCLAAVIGAGVTIGSALGVGTFENCFCEEIVPTLMDGAKTVVRVTYIYREFYPENYQISVGSQVCEEPTCYDVNHQLFAVTYDGVTQSNPSVSRFMPLSELNISRREVGSPGNKSRNYVGKVNSGGWTHDENANARTWMCNSITGTSKDGTNYDVTYTFTFNENTFDSTQFWLDPDTKRLPDGITAANPQGAIQTFVLYESVNFNGLNL